jgi:hypothetical protein
LPSSHSEWSRHPDPSAFRSSIARPTSTSGLRFKKHLAMFPARLEARMESLFSFPVGLFHPLQHAGLARRSPSCRQTGSKVTRYTFLITHVHGAREWPCSPWACTRHLREMKDSIRCMAIKATMQGGYLRDDIRELCEFTRKIRLGVPS